MADETRKVMRLIATSSNKIRSLPIKDGQLIFLQDLGRIAFDFKGQRVFYNQIVELETESERLALDNPLNGYYFVIGSGCLWFYKDGKVVAEGSVVTGNPSKGYSTTLGTYMINYKQKGATLKGPGYEAKVTYWLPFNGNIGIHDASWRYSFGYNIYKNDGTHGCVNSPLSLAKKIYENIEPGTPVICYEE